MDWVLPFYTQQDDWAKVYSREVTDDDREKIQALARMAGQGPLRILELGAGGGQNAVAAAELGHTVVAVELVPAAVSHARSLAAGLPEGRLTIIEGDFYDLAIPGEFDVVCYWDGFGIGADSDQQRLLQRIQGWLRPEGCALIDINTPWYWAKVAGREMSFDGVSRRYGFDALGCRMLDTWWPQDQPDQAVTQSLRCYSPADLNLILAGTGLVIDSIEEGGAVDYEERRYLPQVPLGSAMQYLVKLRRSAIA
jgi:SAM-dependent methyltransferase